MGVGICLANNPHGLQWSPFIDNLLLISCSQRPGHTPTSGILYALEFMPMNDVAIRDQVQLNIGLDLVAASERDANTCVTSCEDNTLRFFDFSNDNSVLVKEWFLNDYRMSGNGGSSTMYHTKPSALAWDRISLEQILTANGGHNSVDVHSLLLNEEAALADAATATADGGGTEQHVLMHCDQHDDVVLDAKWNTHAPFSFMSCDRSGHAYLWDMRTHLSRREGDAAGGSGGNGGPALKFRLHNNTCGLKMDQNVFDEYSLAFACFNHSLMTYDLRMTERPKAHVANAHVSLMTNVSWSPHTQHLVATSSVDRTMRIWDMRKSNQEAAASLAAVQAQSHQNPEVVDRGSQRELSDEEMRIDESYGGAPSQFKDQQVEDWVNNCAWNVHEVGLMAICCNDHLVKAYNIREDQLYIIVFVF